MSVIKAAGFDQYGYNYTARLVNAWYGQQSQKYSGHDWDGTTLDAWLVMKWSKDWTPQANEPTGAWDTNHWTWYSNDYAISTYYGWDSRVAWNDASIEPASCYKIDEFMKIMKVTDDLAAWQGYQAGGAYSAGWGTYSDGVPMYVVFQDVISVLGKSWPFLYF